MNTRAIAWDIDGTLVDSEPLHLDALLAVCQAHNIDISDLPDEHFIGIALGDVWTELKIRFPDDMTERAWSKQLNEYYQTNAHRLCPIVHAQETVHKIASLGIRQVAVSNSNRIIVDANLMALGICDLMEFSISVDDVLHGKPDPAPYFAAANRLCVPVSNIIAVEDSSTGIRSARDAGLRVIGFGDSTSDLGFAHTKVSSLLDILSHI